MSSGKQKNGTAHRKSFWRCVGVSMLMLAVIAMAWDVYSMMGGMGLAHFSGIGHVWQTAGKSSYEAMHSIVLAHMGYSAWEYFAIPLLTAPASALFGIPGLLLIKANGAEIQAREPSLLELEMVRQGFKPHHYRAR